MAKKKGITDAMLRALLDRDLAGTGLVTSRGGKISRSHYAACLGAHKTGIGAKFASTFSEYEAKYDVATGPLKRLSEMRTWLDVEYKTRALALRGGKLDRQAFQDKFQLRGGAWMTKYPQLRALFESFDARASREGYIPADKQQELDRVVEALKDNPSRNKDRITINREALARVTKIPKTRLRDKPFSDLIAALEAHIMGDVEACKIDPYVHGRVFPFSQLAPAWPVRFLERVGTRFKQVVVRVASQGAKVPYLQLINALAWIGGSDNPHCRIVVAEAEKSGSIRSRDDWEEALFAYRDNLIRGIAAGTVSDRLVDDAISALRTMLEALSSGGVVPSTSTPLPGVKHSRRRAGHLRSVAEADVYRSGDTLDYVEFARARYLEACQASALDMGMMGSEEFIESLAIEFDRTPGLPKDPASAIRHVLERRLNALRVGADLKLTRRADLKLTRGGDGHARWPSVDNSTVCFC